MNQSIHACRHLAVYSQNVLIILELQFVVACQITLARHQIVDQNVQSILIVQASWLVLMRDVLILALARAE